MASNMNLTINNKPNSSATGGQIYVCMLGNDPSDPDNKFGYMDFATGSEVRMKFGSPIPRYTLRATRDTQSFRVPGWAEGPYRRAGVARSAELIE